jgi:hypothetical protein
VRGRAATDPVAAVSASVIAHSWAWPPAGAAVCSPAGLVVKIGLMRKASATALVLLVAVVGAFVAGRDGSSNAGSTPAGDEEEVDGARACGVERWRVKTLMDKDAGKVDFTPQATTVDALRARPAPATLSDRRGRGVERTTFRVRADLVSMKREDDSDVHLVIAQPGQPSHTMIVEFPASACTHGASRGARARMAAARRSLDRACGTASSGSFTDLHGQATVTGVGFFDFKHGQRGVAPNAIELHPVTAFKATGCR